MNKFDAMARQFLGWWSAPAAAAAPEASAPAAAPKAAPAPPAVPEPAAAATPAAASAPAPGCPAPAWNAIPPAQTSRFYPRVVELADARGYVVLRFYWSECQRTLITPHRLPLPQAVRLPGPLFALEETAQAQAGGQGEAAQAVAHGFRYVLPPILYSNSLEMEAILMQTRQEMTRLLEKHCAPALPREEARPAEPDDLLTQTPPPWLDAPSVDGAEGPPSEAASPALAAEDARTAPAEEAGADPLADKPFIEEWTGTLAGWYPKGEDRRSDTPLLAIEDDARGGELTRIKGRDLLRAMKESHARKGDRVRVRYVENMEVEVYQHGKRKEGAYKKIFHILILR